MSRIPFRYGWRYVRVQRPDGTEEFDQVPLTLEDVLFPETGDFIVQTDPHDNDVVYLKIVFKSQLADDPRLGGGLGLPGGLEPAGGPAAGPRYRGVPRHGGISRLGDPGRGGRGDDPRDGRGGHLAPHAQNDLESKFDYYNRARVPLYVIVNAIQDNEQGSSPELDGVPMDPGGLSKDRAESSGLDLAGAGAVVAGHHARPATGIRSGGLFQRAGRRTRRLHGGDPGVGGRGPGPRPGRSSAPTPRSRPAPRPNAPTPRPGPRTEPRHR